MREGSQFPNRLFRKTVAAFLCILLISASLGDAAALATETEQKTVRVGDYVNRHFQEGAWDTGTKRGYGYEYRRKAA